MLQAGAIAPEELRDDPILNPTQVPQYGRVVGCLCWRGRRMNQGVNVVVVRRREVSAGKALPAQEVLKAAIGDLGQEQAFGGAPCQGHVHVEEQLTRGRWCALENAYVDVRREEGVAGVHDGMRVQTARMKSQEQGMTSLMDSAAGLVVSGLPGPGFGFRQAR